MAVWVTVWDSSMPSLSPNDVAYTVRATFQLCGVNVSEFGVTSNFVASLLTTATIAFAVGGADSRTV